MDLTVWKNNLKAVKSQRNYGLLLNVFLSVIIILCLLIIYKKSNQHSTVISIFKTKCYTRYSV